LWTSDDDLRLIESMKKIFQKEETEKGCKIASQCRRTLALLSSTQDDNHSNADSFTEPDKILIPYFGTLVRRRAKQTSVPVPLNAPSSNNSIVFVTSTLEPTTDSTTATQNFLVNTRTTEYGGSHLPNPVSSGMHWEVDGFGNLLAGDLSPWPDTTIMDIDQDWSLFLNTDGLSEGT
jgi:hypothetical protein